MKWVRISENLPLHGQEVLVKHNGILYLATYNRFENAFESRGGTVITCQQRDCWSGMAGLNNYQKPEEK